jgi:hypothetical protein
LNENYNCSFFHDFFCYIFFKIIFIDFIVLNIELVENYKCKFFHETL